MNVACIMCDLEYNMPVFTKVLLCSKELNNDLQVFRYMFLILPEKENEVKNEAFYVICH